MLMTLNSRITHRLPKKPPAPVAVGAVALLIAMRASPFTFDLRGAFHWPNGLTSFGHVLPL
jgi:hypothetical protein